MTKIKIGIITVVRANNFGAELQAFALQNKLNSLGYQAEVIDYLYFKNPRYIATKESRPEMVFGKKQQLKNKILYRIINPILNIILPIVHSKTKRRIKNFELFHQNNTKFSKEFRSIRMLNRANHNYDIYITGSDQVWNPLTFTSLKPYFLDFVPPGKTKLSYAASFGVSDIDTKYHNFYKKYLKSIDCISVREKQGAELVKKITNNMPRIVLDPTLLLSKKEWEQIEKPIAISEGIYLLIYDLHESDSIINLADEIKKQLNCKIYRICKRSFLNKKYSGIINITYAGPAEFIFLFNKATYVLTNSFHGTAFSVKFNIPFFSVLTQSKSNNSRIIDFLKMVDLENRIIWEGSNVNNILANNLACNFKNANVLLDFYKEDSIKFILKGLQV